MTRILLTAATLAGLVGMGNVVLLSLGMLGVSSGGLVGTALGSAFAGALFGQLWRDLEP